MVTSVAFGNLVGIVLNTKVINSFGVKYAFSVPAMICLFIAIIVLFLIFKIKKPSAQKSEKRGSVSELLRQKVIILSLFMAFVHGMIKENVTVWMAVYFVDTYAVNLTDTSTFVLFVPLVGLIGRLVYPILYKICSENEHITSLFGFLFCAAAAFLIVICKINAVWSLVFLSVVYAAVSLVNTSLLSIVPVSFAKTGNVATVSGMMDFSTYLGGGIGSFLYGLIIARSGYSPMFISWGVLCVVCILFAATATKIKHKETICI